MPGIQTGAQRLQALSQSGLTYTESAFERERYEQIRQSDAYQESENKTRLMHNELAEIRQTEVDAHIQAAREASQDALMDWLRTGENPPAGMEGAASEV